MLRALLNLPRVIFSGFMAVTIASVSFYEIDRDGDPQAMIAEVENHLENIDEILQRHTYELKEANSPKPTNKSRCLWKLSSPDEKILIVEGPCNPGVQKISEIYAELQQKGKKLYVSYDSAWLELQDILHSLTTYNKRIAERKALRYLKSKPDNASFMDWEYRRDYLNENQWRIQETIYFQVQRVLYSLGIGLGVFTALMLFLALCGWLWEAFLARVREFENARRGK